MLQVNIFKDNNEVCEQLGAWWQQQALPRQIAHLYYAAPLAPVQVVHFTNPKGALQRRASCAAGYSLDLICSC